MSTNNDPPADNSLHKGSASQKAAAAGTRYFQKAVIALALLYLLLPNILFLFGWVESHVAVPLALALVAAAAWVLHCAGTPGNAYSRKDWCCLAAVLAGCLLLTEMVSFHGHALQMSDMRMRICVYDTLRLADWPLFNLRDNYFVYYLAYWLPPALASRFLAPVCSAETVLFWWTWLGLACGFTLIFVRWGKLVLPFFCIVFLLGSPADWINFSGGDIWNRLGDSPVWTTLHQLNGFISGVRFFVWDVEVIQTFNHALPCFLVFAFFCANVTEERHIPFICALLLPFSPLGAICIFILMLCRLRNKLTTFAGIRELLGTPTVWIAIAAIIPTLLYFRLSDGAGVTFMPLSARHAPYTWYESLLCYGINASLILLPARLMLRPALFRGDIYFRTAVVLTLITPLVWLGVDVNELMYKAGAIIYPCLAWCYTRCFHKASPRGKQVFALFLLLSAGAVTYRSGKIATSYTWNEEKMQTNRLTDAPSGRTDSVDTHYGEFLHDTKFWPAAARPCPPLLQHEGESAQGVLAPFATGAKSSQLAEPAE